MKQVNAIVGGEGNGGVILPDIHLGRDAPIAVALTLQHLAEHGGKITELKQSLPQFYILKDKAPIGDLNPEKVLSHFTKKFEDADLDETDGLRIDRSDSWIHLRKSNTEPIMRIIVEARTPEKAWQILQESKSDISKL